MQEKQVRGINILNPVDIDREYYLNSIEYAIRNNYNHIQINGPIHNLKRSNLDGMMFKSINLMNSLKCYPNKTM